MLTIVYIGHLDHFSRRSDGDSNGALYSCKDPFLLTRQARPCSPARVSPANPDLI